MKEGKTECAIVFAHENVRQAASVCLCFIQFSASCPCARLFCIILFHFYFCLSAPCHLHVRYKASGVPRPENASKQNKM